MPAGRRVFFEFCAGEAAGREDISSRLPGRLASPGKGLKLKRDCRAGNSAFPRNGGTRSKAKKKEMRESLRKARGKERSL